MIALPNSIAGSRVLLITATCRRVITDLCSSDNNKMTSNSWVLITGGNRGLGFLTAKKLVTEGHSVIVGARTQASGAPPETLMQDLRELAMRQMLTRQEPARDSSCATSTGLSPSDAVVLQAESSCAWRKRNV